MEKEKKVVPEYEKPEVKDFGDLQELTNATLSGTHIDVPIGTPFGDGSVLDTFS